jgi:hypothetical protein
MPLLFTEEHSNLTGKVINAGYHFAMVLLTLAGSNYVFSVETYPQADSQKTQPIQASPVSDEEIAKLTASPTITKNEALTYWTSNADMNADGTRKGGIFGSANFSLGGGDIFIGDTIYFDIIRNTHKNTEIQIDAITTADSKSSQACNIKAYACQNVSPQSVVDTPNFVLVDTIMYVFVIARGLLSKTLGKVDYPSTDTTQSIALAGGGFVGGNQTVQDAHDAETTEEGANAKDAVVMQTFNLPQRTDSCEEPRYCPFSFTAQDGTIKTFGMMRGRTNNVQVRYFGSIDTLPTMYKATDKTEVMAGFWMPVKDFINLSNNPITAEGKYVPWIAHQAIVREAVAEISARYNQ